jgi:F-type H+-transporting ATPase subunit a
MENSFFVNLNREINSPLNQFDVREFVSITVNVLGNLNLAITNIAVFLTMSGFYLLFSNLLSTYYNKVVGNS